MKSLFALTVALIVSAPFTAAAQVVDFRVADDGTVIAREKSGREHQGSLFAFATLKDGSRVARPVSPSQVTELSRTSIAFNTYNVAEINYVFLLKNDNHPEVPFTYFLDGEAGVNGYSAGLGVNAASAESNLRLSGRFLLHYPHANSFSGLDPNKKHIGLELGISRANGTAELYWTGLMNVQAENPGDNLGKMGVGLRLYRYKKKN